MFAPAPHTRVGFALGLWFGFYLFLTPSRGQTQPPRPPSPPFALEQLRFAPLHLAARPAGLGGAFLGVANDASAAASNPAGVAFLTRPEISLNQAWSRTERNFSHAQKSDATESRMHFNSALVSFVYPFKGFTLAFYRQLAFRAGFDFEREQYFSRAYARPLTLAEQLGAPGNLPGARSAFALEVWQDALVFAKTFPRRVRLGLALRATQLRFNLHERHYFAPETWLATSINNGARGLNTASGLYRIYHVQHEEFRPSFNFGALVELIPQVTLGFTYQNLPRYRLTQTLTLPPYVLPERAGSAPVNFAAEERKTAFKLDLPDHIGLGLSWKPESNTLLAFETQRHMSRRLLRDLAEKNLPQDDTFNNVGEYVDPDGREDWTSANAWTWRFGLERLFFLAQTKIPLRFGFYREEEFGLRAVTNNADLQSEYPKARPLGHFTCGTGLIVKSFRFEMSFDFSEDSFEGLGSVVMSF